jgi:NAD(P)-dependent dehydrogenase (short-subunit alcohol dehydrogenase family)
VRCPCCGDQGRVRSGCRGIACNVSDWVQCGHLVEASYDHFGKVDILVNDAGLSPLYPSVDAIDEALFDKVIGVNLKGPFRLTAAIGTRMVTDGGGSIINVTSIEAIRPSANAVPYSAAKAGLNAMTEAMAKALAPTVRVNAIQAGPFLTDVSKAWNMTEFHKIADRSIALRRGGDPREIVRAAVYFASEASSYCTGSILRLDGGAS